MERPLLRLTGRTSQAAVRTQNDSALERIIANALDQHPAEDGHDEHERFWEGLADDLDDHAHHLGEHSRRANKLAETVRTTMVVRKVAGRTQPNGVHYVQTTTKKSNRPFT